MSHRPYQALLFDCDGVLVDSEPLVIQVLVEQLGDMGWTLQQDEAVRLFTGRMVRDQAALIHAHTGVMIDAAWEQAFRARRDQLLAERLTLIAGADLAVAELHRHWAGRMAVASGADIGKVRMQLQQTGLAGYFGAHVYSGQDLPANKPAPDVYLHAARQLGAAIEHCVVIEDSVTGIRAGAAAGATVLAYAPPDASHFPEQALRQAGARQLFNDMAALPGLLQALA